MYMNQFAPIVWIIYTYIMNQFAAICFYHVCIYTHDWAYCYYCAYIYRCMCFFATFLLSYVHIYVDELTIMFFILSMSLYMLTAIMISYIPMCIHHVHCHVIFYRLCVYTHAKEFIAMFLILCISIHVKQLIVIPFLIHIYQYAYIMLVAKPFGFHLYHMYTMLTYLVNWKGI